MLLFCRPISDGLYYVFLFFNTLNSADGVCEDDGCLGGGVRLLDRGLLLLPLTLQ